MAASDLRRLMYLMGSAVTERRFRQLRLSGLFQEVRSTVAEAHGAVASHGSIWGYNEPIRSACGELVEVLEAVLRRHHLAVHGATFAADLAFRQAVARMLSMLLAEIVEEGAFELMDGRRSSSDRAIPRFRLFRPTTPCPQPARAMVGRSDSVKKIVGVLLREEEDGGPPSLSVVPIVGAPGIGKTRLAQALFCDARVTEHFDMLFWVYVSHHFDPIQILTKILQLFLQHGGRRAEKVEAFDPEQLFRAQENKQAILQKLVHQALLGTSYLIVLDDVWNGSKSEWSILMAALPSDTRGRVVLTTRIPAVADSLMASIKPTTTKPYFLHPLPKESVLSFVHRWTRSFPADVTEIGMKIADKCDGVPLLLEYAGSFLRERPIKLLWQQYLDFFYMLPDGDAILESAFASFYHLPSVLQKCLLHCSVFPMDYNFYAEELTSHLAAEGFLPRAMTDAQRGDLLHKLLSECFYKVGDPARKGRYTYKMHKILHAFARRIDTQDSPGRSAQVRAGAMHSIPIRYTTILIKPQTASFPSWLFELKELRTLVLLQEENMCLSDQQCEIKDIPDAFCRSLRHLRALSLEATKIRMIPRNFELLSYLRYLNLSHTDIRTIPSTISKLHFLRSLILSHCKKLVKLHENTTKLVWLQELDLQGCQYLVELPGNISNVSSLIYLNVCQCLSLKQMPYRIGRLTNLKTLLGYVFSNNEGCAISELRSLINLNLLILESLENISDLGEARDAQLQEKLKLQALTLRWKMHIEGTNYSKVLESLQPNQGLERLEIIAYQGEELPPWISSELYLSCLIEIRLINLTACKSLPPLGLLPLLKNVEISGAEAISSVDKGFYGNNGTFPSLEKLTFSYMINLEVWKQPSYAGAFPCLAQVTIIQCPKLALDLELPAVEKLTLWMNNTVLYSSKGGLRGLARSLKHAMVSFCEEMVTSSDCQGLQDICGVQILEICGCHEMKCLPQVMQHFSSLRRLAIDSCSKLEMLPNWLERLPSLHSLRLSGCPMLRSIPQVLSEHPRAKICVDSCPNLPLDSSGKSVLTQDKGNEIMKDEEDLQSIIDEDED